MVEMVAKVVKECMSCARGKVAFRESGKNLQPLPIKGPMYRWGVDFAGPMEETNRGNRYVLVCIEHFTKWVELIPTTSKKAAEVAYQFKSQILSRYGALGEVITDQGSEFRGEFETLLARHEITHRTATRDHPRRGWCTQ